jgi:uncharacterized YccA/Bax inhibitor family protein
MTLDGTINRAAFLLFCVIAIALWIWAKYTTLNRHSLTIGLLICLVVAPVLSWVTVWKKHWSPITAPAYALLEGFLIGVVSAGVEARHPGIAIQAVAMTFLTCFCMLAAYRSGLIRVTERFNMGLVAATMGVSVLYLAVPVLNLFFHVRIFAVFGSGVLGILISAAVAVLAGLSLVADANFIEQCARSGLPKYMERYTAFAFVVTLVWLYIQVLDVLSKVRKAEGKA